MTDKTEREFNPTEKDALAALINTYENEGFTHGQATWNSENDRDSDTEEWRRACGYGGDHDGR